MLKQKDSPKNVDEYIRMFPKDIQDRLKSIREIVKKAAPQAEEVLSYQMPAYKLNGILLYFAAFKNHIGFFPTPSGIEAFRKELSGYELTKGTIHLPYDKKNPVTLIKKIIKFRVKENLEKKKKK